MKKLIILISLCNLHPGFAKDVDASKTEVPMKKNTILGLHTTIYKMGNLEMAKQWYAKAFKVTSYFDKSFYLGFNIGGYELGLQPEEPMVIEKAESVVSYWGVQNISEVYDHFIEQSELENEKPYNVGGGLMTATVIDPFGNIIGLIYNPYFRLKD